MLLYFTVSQFRGSETQRASLGYGAAYLRVTKYSNLWITSMDNKFLRSTLISVEWLQKIILPYWPSPSKYVKKSPNEIGHFDKTWSYFLKALSLLRSHAYCFFEVHSGLDFQNKVHYPKENNICRSCYFFSMLRPLCIWSCDVCCIFKTPLFIGVYYIAFYFIDNNYKLRLGSPLCHPHTQILYLYSILIPIVIF